MEQGYNLRQEVVNTITHALGILFGLACMPILITSASYHSDISGIIGIAIYSFCFIMLFTSSTMYHWCQHQGRKRMYEIWDHISIYFLIAGTYTPFILIYMKNTTGIILLSVLWGLTLLGTIFKLFYTGRLKALSTFIYLAMGWILVFAVESFFANMSLPVIIFVLSGGILYSIGVIFYIRDRFTYSHGVWHFFVLAAAICHYVAISLSV